VLKNTLLSRRREKLEVLFVVEGRRHPIGDASLIITCITIYIDNIYCIYSSLSLGVYYFYYVEPRHDDYGCICKASIQFGGTFA
jgi:hypothetical protein